MTTNVLNVRQVAQYPRQTAVPAGAVALIQLGEMGQPYGSILAADFVATALAQGGTLNLSGTVGGAIQWSPSGSGGPVTLSAVNGELLVEAGIRASKVSAAFVDAASVTQDGIPILTQAQFDAAPIVSSFNFRTGDVQLELPDILRAGGAPIRDAHFAGWITAPSVWDTRANDDTVATTNWVHRAICAAPIVHSFNGRICDVTLTTSDVNAAYAVPGPPWPTAPSPVFGDASSRIATTLFVDETASDLEYRLKQDIASQIPISLAGYAPLASPQFSGIPTAPTANPGTSTGQLATTAFVKAAVTAATAGVASFNTRTGAVVLTTADVTGVGGALLAGPAFTGAPTAPTAAPGTSNTVLATTAFVASAVAALGGVTSFNTRTGAVSLTLGDITAAGGAPLASPTFTGVPAAPTASAGTSTTQLATCAFVASAVTAAGGVTSFNGRTGAITLQANDLSAAGGALVASPTFTGVPAAPTAALGTNSTQLATTAFVMAQLAAGGVSSFNGRTGAVTLSSADVSTAGGALLASPAFSGTPTATTAAPGTNNTQIATTAYVMSALGGSVVSTFNGRSGAVTLNSGDITGAGGALLAGPAFTGVPTAPTATAGNSSTQLATTAFVSAAITAGSVTSFNSRTGAVTLQANDISAAGGALLASPALTGTPTAPTATTGTNTNQIATCTFVLNELGTIGGVTSFNGRAGVVTLTLADLTGAGGAPAASPTFTGTVTVPTPASAGAAATKGYVDGIAAPVVASAGSFVFATMSANQSIVSTTANTLAFDTVVFDTNSEYSGASRLFTAKRAGYYRATLLIQMSSTAANPSFYAQIWKNGAVYVYGTNVGYAATGNTSGIMMLADTMVHLAVGDTLSPIGMTTVQPATVYGAATTISQFQVQLLALG